MISVLLVFLYAVVSADAFRALPPWRGAGRTHNSSTLCGHWRVASTNNRQCGDLWVEISDNHFTAIHRDSAVLPITHTVRGRYNVTQYKDTDIEARLCFEEEKLDSVGWFALPLRGTHLQSVKNVTVNEENRDRVCLFFSETYYVLRRVAPHELSANRTPLLLANYILGMLVNELIHKILSQVW